MLKKLIQLSICAGSELTTGRSNAAHPRALNIITTVVPRHLWSQYTTWQIQGPVCNRCCCPHAGERGSAPPPRHWPQRCSLQPFSLRHKFSSTQPRFPPQKQNNATRPGRPVLPLPPTAAHAAEIGDQIPGSPGEQPLLASHLPPGKPCLPPGGGGRPGSPTHHGAPPGSSALPCLPPAPAARCAAGCFASSCPQRPHNSCGLNYQNNILIVS